MTEAEVTNISRWLADDREKALIAPKENGQELLDCWVGLPEQRFLNYKKLADTVWLSLWDLCCNCPYCLLPRFSKRIVFLSNVT